MFVLGGSHFSAFLPNLKLSSTCLISTDDVFYRLGIQQRADSCLLLSHISVSNYLISFNLI